MSEMERNTDRMWYDRGYALGVTETKRDAKWPRMIGYAGMGIASHFAPLWAGVFFVIYAAFEIVEWRRRCEEADHRREHDNPGKRYE